MDRRPIGIFDSGVGGLTVARAIMDQLPRESITYIGDSANNPYGEKDISFVRDISLAHLDRLASSGVKMLVIACNTASAAVLDEARERYEKGMGIPVIEVINPAAGRAVNVTRTGKVGVIATQATVSSNAYEKAFSALVPVELSTQACPLFVEFVERGLTSGDEVLHTAEEYLRPMREAGVDTLVLGCTHYPLLAAAIGYVMGEDVALVSSSQEAARAVYRYLAENDLFAPEDGQPQHTWMTTGDPESFSALARRFLRQNVQAQHIEEIKGSVA
ncbi:MAG: glutamate racemase [Actinomycetaceae bacterium]|nr:glutamate racemase [Actinomycetaceae bacterium]